MRIKSDLAFNQITKEHFVRAIDYLFLEYGIEKLANGTMEQIPFPPHSIQETEAVANSVDVCEKLLNYKNYNARVRDDPKYYDYDEAFRLVDSGELLLFRQSQSKSCK